MNNLFFRRALAFMIDYVIIMLYALLLFLLSTLLKNFLSINLDLGGPLKNQLLSFLILTLPVFFYFYISEKKNGNSTFGKKVMRLKVVSEKGNILLRNMIKFLPWEIAHIGVHHVVFYDQQQLETPIWIWACLIIPQIVVILFALSVFRSKGERSVYDTMAGTRIIQVS